jgi:hypothetical protein
MKVGGESTGIAAATGLAHAAPAADAWLIADFGHPIAAEYAKYLRARGQRVCEFQDGHARSGVGTLVIFLGRDLHRANHQTVDALLAEATQCQTELLIVVSTYRVHLADRHALRLEQRVVERAESSPGRLVVMRPAHLISPTSRVRAWLGRLASCYPLVPSHLCGCCLDAQELYAAIDAERKQGSVQRRVITLLGPNRPWRDWLKDQRRADPVSTCLWLACVILSWLLIGHLLALAVGLLARYWSVLRCWRVDTLRPGSREELLTLYNPFNYQYVKVVGYNNGVVHFGHRYPRKTVVSTVSCNRVERAGPDLLRAECGATVRRALDCLAGGDRELPVVPNYSYVALGTAFFIPIHGSAADFSTIADTITRVLLYDPIHDRIIDARRTDAEFRDCIYNLNAAVLLLELDLKLSPRSRYYVQRQTLPGPSGLELLNALRDTAAANVEIRKANAGAAEVLVARYFKDPANSPAAALELPRDSLGRLWDRLEENPITSWLMHALTRRLAWHVELFFTADEFATFWQGHGALPLRKLQLRYIRRDGLPHSYFRDHDCVSVDLFVFRRHREPIEAYLRKTFPVIRSNPGKHTR